MSDNIVPLRPRDRVARRIQGGATTPVDERLPVRIHGEIGLCRLLRSLQTEGLTARLDVDTGEVVIEEQPSRR